MRALVTGASGFIGKHLVRALVERGDSVRCLVRPTSDRSQLEPLGVDFAVGDITDPESLVAAVEGVEVVYHLASLLKMPWKKSFHTINAEGTRNVARACAEAEPPPALIVVSSLAAGGPVREGARSEVDGSAPVSIYGRVKLAAEQAALEWREKVPITIARPPMVYGEGDTSVLKAFRSVRGGWHLVPGFGTRQVSMVHARDLAEALIACAERGERAFEAEGSGLYYVSDTHSPSYADFGRLLATALGRKTRVLHVPGFIMWLAAAFSELVGRLRDRQTLLNLDKYREAMAGSWVCDPGKAMRELDWKPRPTAERLDETVEWYRSEGWL